jgi:WD40 repeat protein
VAKRLFLLMRRQPLATAAAILLAGLLLAGIGWRMWSNAVLRQEEQARLYDRGLALAGNYAWSGQLDRAVEVLDDCPRELREWDWHYLRRVCSARLRLRGHQLPVTSVCYDARGGRLLTGSKDGTARLWDATTGKVVRQLGDDHRGGLTACFIAEGRLVVTAGEDQDVHLYEADTGKPLRTLKKAGEVAAGDRQGRFLATVGRSRRLRVFDLATQEQKPLWERALASAVICLAMSPDGKRLAVAGFDGPVKVMEVAHERELPDLPLESRCWALAFSGDGKWLAVGTERPTLWETTTGKKVRTFSGPGSPYCTALDFSRDGRFLAAPYRDGQVVVWDVSSGRTVMAPVRHRQGVQAAAFSPDGSSLAVTRGREVTIETVETKRLATAACEEWKAHRHKDLEALTFSRDGRWLASRSGGGEVVLHDRQAGGKPRRFAVGDPGKGKVLAFLDDAQKATWLLAGGDNLLKAWQADSGKAGTPSGVSLPSKGAELLVASGDRPLAFLTGKNQIQVGGQTVSPGIEVEALAYKPGGDRLAAGGSDGVIRLWQFPSGNQRAVLRGHRGKVTALAFTSNGRFVAAGGADLTVRVWDTHHPEQPLHTLSGHGGSITALAFTPNGRRLASCGNDGQIKVWDVQTGSELLTLTAHDQLVVSAVAFSPDGKWLASCGHDGVVRLWDGRPLEDP